MSRAINDPLITHAVIANCHNCGYGVLAWATEFEAYAVKKLCSCRSVTKIERDNTGDPKVPQAAKDIIMASIG